MNLDPKKIEELITLYSELDDEYQEELFSKAKVLSIKQRQHNRQTGRYATWMYLELTELEM